MKLWALPFFFVVLSALAFGNVDGALQVPTAETELNLPKVETEKLTAGDVFVLKVRPPQGLERGEPSISGELKNGPVPWGNGRILWWKASEREAGVIEIALTSYRPEKFEVKPIVFVVEGKPAFATNAVSVEYQPLGKKVPENIYEPRGIGFPKWVWVLLSFLVLIFLVTVVWIVLRWLKKRRDKLVAQKANKPDLEPYEELQLRLREIEKKGYLESQKFKPHYFGISEGVKHFLGRAYGFDAEECTSRELVLELKRRGHDDVAQAWALLFDEMDLVKFTDHVPKLEDAKSLIQRAVQLGSRREVPKKNEI